MHIVTADIMRLIGRVDAICITTNESLNVRGECIMGAGIAKQAKNYWPDIPLLLGNQISAGNKGVQVIKQVETTDIVSFPTKPGDTEVGTEGFTLLPKFQERFPVGTVAQGWAFMSSIDIIKTSVDELVDLAHDREWNTVAMPVPGVGFGGLPRNEVMALLEDSLDDRFWVCKLKAKPQNSRS